MARRSASVSFGSSLMISDALTAPSIVWSRRLVSAEIAPLANRKRAETSDWCYIPERPRSQTASQKFAQGKVTSAERAIHFGRLSRAFSARLGSDRSLAAASRFDIAPLALMRFAASCRELQASGPCSPEASCYEVLDQTYTCRDVCSHDCLGREGGQNKVWYYHC